MSDETSLINPDGVYAIEGRELIRLRELERTESIEPSTITMIPPKRTQGDRIRAMSNEELAAFIGETVSCDSCWIRYECRANIEPLNCNQILLAWLESEVDDAG